MSSFTGDSCSCRNHGQHACKNAAAIISYPGLTIVQQKCRSLHQVPLQPTGMTTFFQNALQQVPCLLQCLVPSSGGSSTPGVKDLRCVCKQFRVTALLAVRTCCIKLSPVLSDTGLLLELATLLKDSRLQHLRVDIHVSSGERD